LPCRYEPPETATPELDADCTVPVDGWSPFDNEFEELELVEVEELEELDAVAALAVLPEDAEAPGMVSALIVPKMPTPATAAKAMPAVRLLSSDSALSRARIRTSAALVVSMAIRLDPASQSSM